jgi:hypothetical protein
MYNMDIDEFDNENGEDDGELDEDSENEEVETTEEIIAEDITEFHYPLVLDEFKKELEDSSKETIGYNMFREGALAAIDEIFSNIEDEELINKIADNIIEEYEQNHDFEDIDKENTSSKNIRVNCFFCKKEIECPKNMLNSEKHICFDCFKNNNFSVMEDMKKGKIHIDIPESSMPEFIAKSVSDDLVKNVFPKIWSKRKEELKEISRKEAVEQMFAEGAIQAIGGFLKFEKQKD